MTANLENHIPIGGTGSTGSTGATGPTGATGSTGAGVGTKQLDLLPRGLTHGYWQPGQGTGLTASTATVGTGFNTPTNTATGSGTIYSEGINSYGPHIEIDAPGAGLAAWSHSSDALVDPSALPRFIYRAGIELNAEGIGAANPVGQVLFGLTSSAPTNAVLDFTTATEAIWVEVIGDFNTLSTWSINRRIGSATKTATDTGITPPNGEEPTYVIFEWASTTSVTVTLLNSSYTSLYTTTFSGAPEVPSPTTAYCLFIRSGDTKSKYLYFYGAMLDFDG
tara:strand:- start:90338 stop:91174 length:837 start_codon:yes stop_codon:yes gene_type:complete